MKKPYCYLFLLLLCMSSIGSLSAQDASEIGTADYLYSYSFCEDETPFFFPNPPVLQMPCYGDGCEIALVDVMGEWVPINGGELFPPLKTTEYQIMYYPPPCPAPDCELEEDSIFQEALSAYFENLSRYEGQLGLININDCTQGGLEVVDEVHVICKGDSITLQGRHNLIECPCFSSTDPRDGIHECFPFLQPGSWSTGNTTICNDCIEYVVSPQQTTRYSHQIPPYQCSNIQTDGPPGPQAPYHPAGPTKNILVIVEENCNNGIERFAPPCEDLAGIDFGLCDAVMGYGIVNGECITISGCLNFVVNDIDYSEAIFPTIEVCRQDCLEATPPTEDLFRQYTWLTSLINLDNCNDDQIDVYQSEAFAFINITTSSSSKLYFQDGTFYCESSDNFDCLDAYNLSNPNNSWVCENIDSCICPLIIQPVCGTDGITYDNACLAACAGVGVASEGECEGASGCICPEIYSPVCGVDGIQYINACEAECAGVEIATDGGDCFDAITTTCHDLAGVDFGDCEAIMGVAVVNGSCVTVSGCLDYILGGVNYRESFFPSVEICRQTCLKEEPTEPNNSIFSKYPWLSSVVNPNNCNGESITIYQEGVFEYAYISNGTEANLYFEDGTFYCSDGVNLNCRSAYSLSEIVDTWSCGDNGSNDCDNPSNLDWVIELQNQACTGAIYAFEYEGVPSIYVLTRCACLDATNNLYTCSGELICSTGGFRPIGSGCSLEKIEGQLNENNLIWKPGCECDCVNPIPVCGSDGNIYPSDCDALCAGVEVLGQGDCEIIDPPCLCPLIYAPVCGEDGNSYSNACEAECRGIAVASTGNCGDTPTNPDIFSDYTWLSSIISPSSCTAENISEFAFDAYSFIYIYDEENLGTLYFEDGTFYCQDSPTFNCLDAYGLSTDDINRTWSCLQKDIVYHAGIVDKSNTVREHTLEAITVFPNPTKGNFQIQIHASSKEKQQLKIIDLYGKVVLEKIVQPESPSHMIDVNIDHMPDGVYMIVLQEKGKTPLRKAIIKNQL